MAFDRHPTHLKGLLQYHMDCIKNLICFCIRMLVFLIVHKYYKDFLLLL